MVELIDYNMKGRVERMSVLDKAKALGTEIKTHWNTPAEGKYVPYKEYKDVVIGVGANYTGSKVLEYIGFWSACFLIMHHYKLPYLTFSVIGILNMPLGYITALIWWYVCDNLGFLPKKQERKVYLVYGLMMAFGISTILFDYSRLFDPTSQFITLLKFLKQDDKYTYIASGSLLGVALSNTGSIPIGSIEIKRMYQLDFEEFLIANGFSSDAINTLENRFLSRESLDEAMHEKLLDLFKKYLIVGGLPDAVNEFLRTRNVVAIRKLQEDIIRFYGEDASKYDAENKLKIKRIYDLLPSTMQNTKKRIVAKDIEGITGRRFKNYADEFDYLTNSGIALEVKAIANPVFPLLQSEDKNLLKLYMNDVDCFPVCYTRTTQNQYLKTCVQ